MGGTGDSGTPKSFTHQATTKLPTTYVSYVGIAASDNDAQGCPRHFISFFPMNQKTVFELRAIEYRNLTWALTGGVSQSIGCLIGDCLNGFPGNAACGLGSGAISGGGLAGCRVERSPAVYDPISWRFDNCPSYPANFIYKVTSNSPVLWQMLTHMSHDAQDSDTYAPATTLSYTGLMHYMWRRYGMDTAEGDGDALGMINTGYNAAGVSVPNLPTTVHLFEWNWAALDWDYMDTYELGP